MRTFIARFTFVCQSCKRMAVARGSITSESRKLAEARAQELKVPCRFCRAETAAATAISIELLEVRAATPGTEQ